MNKDAVIQIRVTNEEKQKLKEIAYLLNTTISRMLTKYLDDTLEKGFVELKRTTNNNFVNAGVEISKEELSNIIGGASKAYENEEYDLAVRILKHINDFKYSISKKESFINVRYPGSKKEQIDELSKKNGINISILLDNHIKSCIYDYDTLNMSMYKTDEELEESFNKTQEDIAAGRYYTDDEFKSILKKEFDFDLDDYI